MGLGISCTNADSQWNSVYEVFHRFFCGQVLACTESATSEYSVTSQCLSAILGPARESDVFRQKRRPAHIHRLGHRASVSSFKKSLKAGLGISRTNADSQWNSVYNAFHRNFCGGNETIRR